MTVEERIAEWLELRKERGPTAAFSEMPHVFGKLLDTLIAERERMKPVVEAAKTWARGPYFDDLNLPIDRVANLAAAIDALESSAATEEGK